MNILSSKVLWPLGFVAVFTGVFIFSPASLFSASSDTPGNIDGTFQNPCCAEIRISGNEIRSGQAGATFKIEASLPERPNTVMLSPDRRVSIKGGSSVTVDEHEFPPLLFVEMAEGSPKTLSIPGEKSRRYIFSRVK